MLPLRREHLPMLDCSVDGLVLRILRGSIVQGDCDMIFDYT
jgi:hypothetical protein